MTKLDYKAAERRCLNPINTISFLTMHYLHLRVLKEAKHENSCCQYCQITLFNMGQTVLYSVLLSSMIVAIVAFLKKYILSIQDTEKNALLG